jgi:hypothetical protein
MEPVGIALNIPSAKLRRLLMPELMRNLVAALSAEGPAHPQYQHGGYSRDALEMRRLVTALTRNALGDT